MPPGRITMLFGDDWYDAVRRTALKTAPHSIMDATDAEIHEALDYVLHSQPFLYLVAIQVKAKRHDLNITVPKEYREP